MEFIIFIAFVVLAVLLWNGYVRTKKTESDDAIDKWIPGGPGKNPDQHPLARFNTPADVSGSENRVEEPVADVTAENKAEAVAKVKKAPVKKTAAKPVGKASAKKAPAKKKST
jgi:hypothetical protein